MRSAWIVQGIAFALLVCALAYVVIWSADSWADWVVLGVLVATALGAALAVHERRFISRGRPVSRSSSDRR